MKVASASAAWAAAFPVSRLMAYPLGLPLGLQLYSVREVLPKDYEGTLHQLAAMGYREVEAAGFFNHSAGEVKTAMSNAGLRCVSAHYPLKDLLAKLDETIQFGSDLGLEYIVCASPWFKDPSRVKDPGSRVARESMTLDDWRWNIEQFNRIGARVHAAGMRFAYHNHTPEFRTENGIIFYDEILQGTDAATVSMELDCGWASVAGHDPAVLLKKNPDRFVMLHVKDFKLTPTTTPANAPSSTEMGHGTIDYHPILAAARKAKIKHVFVEQEEFDMPMMDALKIDAEFMSKLS